MIFETEALRRRQSQAAATEDTSREELKKALFEASQLHKEDRSG